MFQKQDPMRVVSYSMIPMLLWGVWLYGWRTLTILAVVLPVAIICEFIFENQRKKKVTEAVFVTSLLYGLSLPPGVPLWVAALGIAFGIVFGKELYGGFGRNVFNPAIVGRVFVYVSSSVMMQTPLVVPGNFGLGGMSYSQASYVSSIPESIFMVVLWLALMFVITKQTEKPKAFVVPLISGVILTIVGYVVLYSMDMLKPEMKLITDTTVTATPLVQYKAGKSVYDIGLLNLFLGIRTGMTGEGSVLLIILAFLYLTSPMAKKVVNHVSSFSTLISAGILLAILYYSGILALKLPAFSPAGKSSVDQIVDILGYLMSGSLFFISVFMVTDPVTSPNKMWSKIVFGIIVGCSTILIRLYSAFPEGVSFAILLGNTFAPLLDKFMPKDAPKKKPATATKPVEKK